jgi:hypothetical protein
MAHKGHVPGVMEELVHVVKGHRAAYGCPMHASINIADEIE